MRKLAWVYFPSVEGCSLAPSALGGLGHSRSTSDCPLSSLVLPVSAFTQVTQKDPSFQGTLLPRWPAVEPHATLNEGPGLGKLDLDPFICSRPEISATDFLSPARLKGS